MMQGELIGRGYLLISADTQNAMKSVTDLGKSALRVLKSVSMAGAALAGAGAVLGIKTAAELEQAKISFDTLLGSGVKAQKFLDGLKKFAATTPFELPGLVADARQLLGVGEAANKVMPTLKAWGDASGALGLSQEQFNRVMLATTQAMAKGKLQGDELMQMTEAGVPIWNLLSKALHKPIPELQKMSSQGKLLSADVLPKLEKQMEHDYGGSMAKQSQTLNGLWSTLKDTLSLTMADAVTPMIPLIKSGLTGAISTFGDISKKAIPKIKTFSDFLVSNVIPAARRTGKALMIKFDLAGNFKKATRDLGDFFKGLTGTGKKYKIAGPSIQSEVTPSSDWYSLGQAVHKVAVQLATDTLPLAKALGGVVKGFIDVVKNTPAGAIQTLADVIIATAITSKVLQLAGAFRALAVGMWAATGPVGLVVAGTVALAYGIGRALGAWKSFEGMLTFMGKGFAQIGRGLASAGVAVWNFFKRGGGLNQAINSANRWLLDAGKNLVLGFWHGINGAWHTVTGFFRGIKDSIVGTIVHSFGIASPARVMIPLGRAIIQGLLVGALAVARGIGGWLVSHVRNPITGAFSGAGTWLTGKGRAVINGLWTGMKGPWSAVTKWVSSLAHWIKAHKGPLSLDGRLLTPAGKALMHGLLRGLKVGFKGVGSFVVDTGKSIASVTSKILSGIGGAFGTLSGGTSGANQRLGKLMMQARGWSADQWAPLRALWMGESGWSSTALNKSSGAYGIPQALPASKMASAGGDWRTNAATQIKWGLSYIKSRYGSPAAAYGAWLKRSPHWYDDGGWLMPGTTLTANATGKPEAVLTDAQWKGMIGDRSRARGGDTYVTNVTVQGGVFPSAQETKEAVVRGLETARRMGYVLPKSIVPKVA